MSSNKETSGGIGFFGLLTIAFVVLRLTGYIEWSWWWVISPIWIPAAIAVAALTIVAILALLSD